jgi:hypothetical protein
MHGFIAVVATVTFSGCVAAQQLPAFEVVLLEYRVPDADSALAASYDLPKQRMLEAFVDVQPHVRLTASGEPGQVMRIEDERVHGSMSVGQVANGKVEVTLELDGFFKGTPLLIDRCTPHIVLRSRSRVQNRVQLVVRAIEIRDQSCLTEGTDTAGEHSS